MNIIEMRELLNETQNEFAKRYNIPFRTIQNWETGLRRPPEYILRLLEKRVLEDAKNKKTISALKNKTKKNILPKRSDYIGNLSWLKAIKEALGQDFVFALDEALMCQEKFLGGSEIDYIYLYGPDELAKYDGVIILGNQINELDVEEKDGLRYTSFNRTINDALINEDILDMQGTIEALSKYYFTNDNNFKGLSIYPQNEEIFKELADNAIEYYDE